MGETKMTKIRGYINTELVKAVNKKFPIETRGLSTTGLIEWCFRKLLVQKVEA